MPTTKTGGLTKPSGYAFDGSNPSPATTCGSSPLAASTRLCGPFLFVPACVTLSRRGPVCCGAHGHIADGVPGGGSGVLNRRLPRTAMDGPCRRRVPAWRAPLSRALHPARRPRPSDFSGRRLGEGRVQAVGGHGQAAPAAGGRGPGRPRPGSGRRSRRKGGRWHRRGTVRSGPGTSPDSWHADFGRLGKVHFFSVVGARNLPRATC